MLLYKALFHTSLCTQRAAVSVPGQMLQYYTAGCEFHGTTDIYLSTCYLQSAEHSCALTILMIILTLYSIASQDKTSHFITKEAVSAQY